MAEEPEFDSRKDIESFLVQNLLILSAAKP
jgi:hypothetical protein